MSTSKGAGGTMRHAGSVDDSVMCMARNSRRAATLRVTASRRPSGTAASTGASHSGCTPSWR